MAPASGKHETTVADLDKVARAPADPKAKAAAQVVQADPAASSAPPASPAPAPVAGDGQ
jgi:hypothetical protein